MLFKLSIKNMTKSIKDYAIYFLTLVLGVAIFYMFNSLDSQQAMLEVSQSTRDIIKLMLGILGFVSIFVAVVLGLLIVYANNFLINRRKKEFGIYMTLGMGKRQISKVILLETILVGIISLAVGLVIGVFASQFMSILVAKLFEADMSEFHFVFSKDACIKTCLYFAVMYLAVMIFNTMTISRYKLINLLNATKKNEKVKMKNPFLAVLVFIFGSSILGFAYWKVTGDVHSMNTAEKMLPPILMGIVGTVLIFWSLSGFIITVIQKMKNIYFKDTNMFVLRQINNKINTMVVSMSVICLMLFMTISILSSSLALRNTMQRELIEMTPVDLNLYKTANLPESYTRYGIKHTTTEEQREDSKHSIKETLMNNKLDMNVLKDIVEIEIYTDSKSSSNFVKALNDNGLEIDGLTKISLREASIGIATIVVFIAIYLGIIFLIASAAILALKQLTDSSDNKQRYTILRKIGCDEKMINKALFRQIGIFFGMPLVLAIIHSIFGIQFAITIMSGLASKDDLLPSIIATVVIICVIYGSYFAATYFGGKNIIK